jgi:hypothetical protein
MNDFAAVLEIAAYAAVVLIPAILVNRFLGGSDGPGLEAVFRIPLDQPWPRGVQEEELTPWRLDALTPRTCHPSRA